jgi:hypothetical protein
VARVCQRGELLPRHGWSPETGDWRSGCNPESSVNARQREKGNSKVPSVHTEDGSDKILPNSNLQN